MGEMGVRVKKDSSASGLSPFALFLGSENFAMISEASFVTERLLALGSE